MKDLGSLPASTIPLDQRVHLVSGCIFIYGLNGHAFIVGNAETTRLTIEQIDGALLCAERGSDRHGLRPQEYGFFYIEPADKRLWLWVIDLHGHEYRTAIAPAWLRLIRPALEIACVEALENPKQERVYRASKNKHGWIRVKTATECGSD